MGGRVKLLASQRVTYFNELAHSPQSKAVLMDLLGSRNPGLLVLIVVVVLFVRSIKRRYFSTLSSIPGPFIASFTRTWRIKEVYSGHVEETELRLHQVHGRNVVPVAR